MKWILRMSGRNSRMIWRRLCIFPKNFRSMPPTIDGTFQNENFLEGFDAFGRDMTATPTMCPISASDGDRALRISTQCETPLFQENRFLLNAAGIGDDESAVIGEINKFQIRKWIENE